MAQIDWRMLTQYADPGQAVQQGFSQGYQLGQEIRGQNALKAYFADPENPNALAALGQASPALAFKAQEYALQRRKYDRELQAQTLQQKAAAGDQAALAQLAGVDLDAWGKLNNAEKAKIKETQDYIGQAALRVSQLPEAERSKAWDQYTSGHPELTQYVGQYSPQALDQALARAGLVDKFLQSQKIEYHQQGERPSFATYGGTGQLVDPASVLGAGAVQASPTADLPVVASPADARKLPPNVPTFRTQDGRTFKNPNYNGGATASPSPTFP